jgi:hypothetical protein
LLQTIPPEPKPLDAAQDEPLHVQPDALWQSSCVDSAVQETHWTFAEIQPHPGIWPQDDCDVTLLQLDVLAAPLLTQLEPLKVQPLAVAH